MWISVRADNTNDVVHTPHQDKSAYATGIYITHTFPDVCLQLKSSVSNMEANLSVKTHGLGVCCIYLRRRIDPVDRKHGL